jgi:hypothetical protein
LDQALTKLAAVCPKSSFLPSSVTAGRAERCAILVDDDFNKETTFYLTRIGSWIEIACHDGAKLGQVFSVRGAVSGDARTKETAVLFKKARTHREAMEAFYEFLKTKK